MKRTSKTKPDDAGQLEAARLIAENPAKYPGALQEWAQLVLDSKADSQHSEDDGKVPW